MHCLLSPSYKRITPLEEILINDFLISLEIKNKNMLENMMYRFF